MDVKVKGSGSSSDVTAQVDPTHAALRTSLRPYEVDEDKGGHYAISSMTGLIGANIASAAEVFQLRWGDNDAVFVLKKLVVQFSTAVGFAATSQGAPVELIVGHGATAAGSGGTALQPTSLSSKMNKDMNTSRFAASGSIRIATTAALTAATGQALEASPIGSCTGADNRTLVSTPPMVLFETIDEGDHPLVLDMGDSLVIRTNTPAATGTWYMTVTMKWAEMEEFG